MDPDEICKLVGGCENNQEPGKDQKPPDPPNPNWFLFFCILVTIFLVMIGIWYVRNRCMRRQIEPADTVIRREYRHRKSKEGKKKYKT